MAAAAPAAPAGAPALPWVEKYRPKTIDDIAQQEEVVSSLRNTLRTGELPNLLFYGTPGTGKTSVALALVQQLFGDGWRKRVKELNASDERGITAVREQVKTFAQLTVGGTEASPGARFRVIILDEADSMTHDAQAALRRIMEEFMHVTRFIIICNYVSKIIEPLHSRCSKFRFKPIDAEFQRARIATICHSEGVKLVPGALEKLVQLSQGDLRYAVNMLQTATAFHGLVDENALNEVSCAVPDEEVKNLIRATCAPASSIADVNVAVTSFLQRGYGGLQILDRLFDTLMADPGISDLAKAKCSTLFSQVDERLTQGCDEEMQLLFLFSSMQPLFRS